ncbi:pyridoxamine 5'-phosphate oxidase family protein [Clostridium saccharoperbutylacetonicum]
MDTKKEFIKIMGEQTEIALATSVNDVCNVRIVNFYYDDNSKILFFSTFGDNEKVKEFEQNDNVAFTTIPHKGNKHIKGKGKVKKSNITIYDIKDNFINKIPEYKYTIEEAGQFLILFEIHVDTVIVTLDFENINTLKL